MAFQKVLARGGGGEVVVDGGRMVYADPDRVLLRLSARGKGQHPHDALRPLSKGQRRAVRRSLSYMGLQAVAHASVRKPVSSPDGT